MSKRTWPGVWTNSFCGHPRPGEPVAEAVHRYADHELGTSLRGLRCLLPSFRYRAVDPTGVVENEVCPVYTAVCDGDLSPNPAEVEEHRWLSIKETRAAIDAAPWALSPWMIQQVSSLEDAGAWWAMAP